MKSTAAKIGKAERKLQRQTKTEIAQTATEKYGANQIIHPAIAELLGRYATMFI